MLEFLKENGATIVVLLAVAVIFAAAVRSVWKSHRAGRCCGCSGGGCAACAAAKKQEKQADRYDLRIEPEIKDLSNPLHIPSCCDGKLKKEKRSFD